MSRRWKPVPAAPEKKAPNDGTALGHLSDEALLLELVRRRTAQGAADLGALEAAAEEVQRQVGEETLNAAIARLPPEGTEPKACPRCGQPVRVKARNRVRRVLTIAGELRVVRNYHYCASCKHGFYPRDAELKLPEQGELSESMERRVLDFGVTDTFAAAAERWSIHYPIAISENLVRRVVDRVGLRMQKAASELTLQQACRSTPEEPPRALVVASDGSMLLTREESWKEAKVAVVAATDNISRNGALPRVTDARYVAVLGGQAEFAASLAAALEAERADEVTKVVWLGDGARENWTLAEKCCPLAIQVLDLPHAIQNGMFCGRALLGEASPLLASWERRLHELLDAPSADPAILELMDCIEPDSTDDELAALDRLVGYYRANDERMRYRVFREMRLPIASGIVESAHKHVLQVRMKRAGQRWGIGRARRMTRLRAAYRTAGARRFHAAISSALESKRLDVELISRAPTRISRRRTTLSRLSSINRARLAAASK